EPRMISTTCHSARGQHSRGPSGVFDQSKLRTRATISGARPSSEAAGRSCAGVVPGSPAPDVRRMSLMVARINLASRKPAQCGKFVIPTCQPPNTSRGCHVGERKASARWLWHDEAGIHNRGRLHVLFHHLLRLEPFNLMDDVLHVDALLGVDMRETRPDLLGREAGVFGEDRRHL